MRLNQARRPIRQGAAEVAPFFTFHAAYPPVRLDPAWLEGREVHLVFEGDRPAYFMCLTWQEGRIVDIRDHRYALYVIEGTGLS